MPIAAIAAADSRSAPRRVLRIGTLLACAVLTLALLRPLLTTASLAPQQTLRAYFEPRAEGVAVALDDSRHGYMTEVEVDARGDLQIPAGRTIAIPLPRDAGVTVGSFAAGLAPYVVLGTRSAPIDSRGVTTLVNAVVPYETNGRLSVRPWNPELPWAEDKAWLRQLHDQCHPTEHGAVLLRLDQAHLRIQIGSCESDAIAIDPSSEPLLLVFTGPHAAFVARSSGPWQQVVETRWGLIALAACWAVLLVIALGSAPAVLLAAILFLVGNISRPEAILVWFMILPFAIAAVVSRLSLRLAPRRRGLAWVLGILVVALEMGGLIAAARCLDIGTFGNERFTREGDDACTLVGYSTVRGDSLRWATGGIVEDLSARCPQCRDRSSRFSREAQILRWVREVVCAPSFPTPVGGEIVFIGGGNDDLFYRPSGLMQRVADVLTFLRAGLQPVAVESFHQIFEHLTTQVVATLDDQAADIAAIAQCARAGGRQFRFVHDFLIWDLDGGRTPARQQTFAARQAAVRSSGGDFVDLFDAFGERAGVTWFNDFIHPSAVGQRMIADLLCTRLTPRAAGGDAEHAVD